MFDVALLDFHEPSKRSKKTRVNIQKQLSFEEQKAITSYGADPGSAGLLNRVIVKNLHDVRRRKRLAKEQEQDENVGQIEFVGRLTGNIYDREGNIKVEKVVAQDDHFGIDIDAENLGERMTSTVNKTLDLLRHDLEQYPRPVYPYRRFQDSKGTRQLYNDPNVSERVRNILKRGDPDRKGLSYMPPYVRRIDDKWKYRTIRMRGIYNLTSIMYISLFRRDYKRAVRAFAYLVRSKDLIDQRLLWSVALELLTWRRDSRNRKELGLERIDRRRTHGHICSNNDASTYPHMCGTKAEDEDYLHWLIINYPYVRAAESGPAKSKFRYRVWAPDLYPLYILSKLKHQDLKGALEILEDITLQSPYSEDPVVFAYYGILNIQLMTKEKAKKFPDENKLEGLQAKVKQCFDECKRLGGDYPTEMIEKCLEFLDGKSISGSDDDASEGEHENEEQGDTDDEMGL